VDRVKCDIRDARDDDRGMLTLLAGETLQPLAEGAGHPERYNAAELLELLDRADVYVAVTGAETVGFVAVEEAGDDLAVRCLCVHPNYEARGVANQLLDWAEGLAVDRRRRRLTAYVPAADQPSLHLYRRHEFAVRPAPGGEMLELEKRLPQLEN
jgi:ribosomal protein S18 acetylase RimI-like enzyme